MNKEWKITEDYIMELEDIIKDIHGILTQEEIILDKWLNEEVKDLEKKHRKNYEELIRTRKYCIVKKDITKKIIELQTVNQLLEILPTIAKNYNGIWLFILCNTHKECFTNEYYKEYCEEQEELYSL